MMPLFAGNPILISYIVAFKAPGTPASASRVPGVGKTCGWVCGLPVTQYPQVGAARLGNPRSHLHKAHQKVIPASSAQKRPGQCRVDIDTTTTTTTTSLP
ncbi:hypothetical protein E2C01_068479 [Portunus trituberculatus]|uniref:Uncharacterized protein n=1 Tax=Portunus trituberculatus TaxID=210409 RepID=A0A5B7HNY0_PORTR|nr:hypothetical protein [Portunus trituberculatus]